MKIELLKQHIENIKNALGSNDLSADEQHNKIASAFYELGLFLQSQYPDENDEAITANLAAYKDLFVDVSLVNPALYSLVIAAGEFYAQTMQQFREKEPLLVTIVDQMALGIKSCKLMHVNENVEIDDKEFIKSESRLRGFPTKLLDKIEEISDLAKRFSDEEKEFPSLLFEVGQFIKKQYPGENFREELKNLKKRYPQIVYDFGNKQGILLAYKKEIEAMPTDLQHFSSVLSVGVESLLTLAKEDNSEGSQEESLNLMPLKAFCETKKLFAQEVSKYLMAIKLVMTHGNEQETKICLKKFSDFLDRHYPGKDAVYIANKLILNSDKKFSASPLTSLRIWRKINEDLIDEEASRNEVSIISKGLQSVDEDSPEYKKSTDFIKLRRALTCFTNIMKKENLSYGDEYKFDNIEKKEAERDSILDLVKNMKDIVEGLKQLEKMSESKTTKTMLNELISGIQEVNQSITTEHNSLHEVKESYARVFVKAHRDLPKTNDLSTDDVRVVRKVRQLIIKAIDYLVPKHHEDSVVGKFFSPWLSLLKMKLELSELDANREIVQAHYKTAGKISRIKTTFGLPETKDNNESKENIPVKNNTEPTGNEKLIEAPQVEKSHCQNNAK